MKFFVLGAWARMRQWTLSWAHSPHAALSLFFIAFIEASFFPIPPDVLMIAILLINAERWWFYAGLTTVGSVLGGILGYLIGLGFYEVIGAKIVEIYKLRDVVDLVGGQFEQNAFLTVFIAALTPLIPFKVITIASGIFKIPILAMIFGAILGRSLRYFTVAFAAKILGRQLQETIFNYFSVFSLLFILALLVLIILT